MENHEESEVNNSETKVTFFDLLSISKRIISSLEIKIDTLINKIELLKKKIKIKTTLILILTIFKKKTIKCEEHKVLQNEVEDLYNKLDKFIKEIDYLNIIVYNQIRTCNKVDLDYQTKINAK